MKKGQVRVIFTWIFILVLAGAILIYGVKVVRDTQKLGEGVLVGNFFKNFNSRVKTYYYLSKESSGVEEFSLPGDVYCVCFTKDENLDILTNSEIGCDIDKTYLVRDWDKLREYDNVFLFADKTYDQERANVNYLSPYNNPVCIEVKGGLLRVRLKNIGKEGVDVSNP